MSKRLQVVFEDAEYRDLQKAAQRGGMTVSQWVREAIRAMRRREPGHDTARKLEAVRAGARHQFPSGDFDDMLAEIESGYGAARTGSSRSRSRVAEPRRE